MPDEGGGNGAGVTEAEMETMVARKKNGLINPGDPDSDVGGSSGRPVIDANALRTKKLNPYIYPTEDEGSGDGDSLPGIGPGGDKPEFDTFGSLIQPPIINEPSLGGSSGLPDRGQGGGQSGGGTTQGDDD